MEHVKPKARVRVFTMSVEKWLHTELSDTQWFHLTKTWAEDKSLHESDKYKTSGNQFNYFYNYREL